MVISYWYVFTYYLFVYFVDFVNYSARCFVRVTTAAWPSTLFVDFSNQQQYNSQSDLQRLPKVISDQVVHY